MGIGCLYFKYRRIDANSLSSLASGEVWYASKSQLNDPFDCDPILERDIDESQVDEILESRGIKLNECHAIERKLELLEGSFYKFLDQAGVFCVSPTPCDELMWGHYGDSHRGMAIGYSVKQENVRNHSSPHKSPLPVRYEGRGYAKLSDFYKSSLKMPDAEEAFIELVQALYFSKNPAWSYENEYRFLSLRKSGLLDIGAEVEAVVFGARTPDKHISLVSRLIGSSVDKYKVILRSGGLTHEKIDV